MAPDPQDLSVPSTSTIRRILTHRGLITPQPRKRPKSSYIRFEAAQPNQCWQSDFTHWMLANDTDIEILNWLHDHSRYLLSATARHRVGAPEAVASFTTTGHHQHRQNREPTHRQPCHHIDPDRNYWPNQQKNPGQWPGFFL
jgi:hypothetical protein